MDIRIKVKASNAILARYADSMGGVAAASEHLGISAATFSHWLNFHSQPCVSRRPSAKVERVLKMLARETGCNIKVIFPLSKPEMLLLEKPRVYEKQVDIAELTYAAESTQRLTYDADKVVLQAERQEVIQKVLRTLNQRDRMVVESRFGLGGETPKTLKEVAGLMGITRERVRQIELRAIRKLQQPSRNADLLGLI